MTKQQIKEAAKRYANSYKHNTGSETERRIIELDFIAGVEWALSQPKDIDKIKEEFEKLAYVFDSDLDQEAIWNFFLPYIQPNESKSDAIEFAEWICENGFRRLEQSEDFSNGEVHRNTNELYEIFKSLPNKP